MITKGNLVWTDGPDSEIKFVPDANGRWSVAALPENINVPGDATDKMLTSIGIDPYQKHPFACNNCGDYHGIDINNQCFKCGAPI